MVSSPSEIKQLTGLRAVAAVMVLFHHLDPVFGNQLAPRLPFVSQGFLGVDIFFVLSGFILSHVYANQVSTLHDYSGFLWRRFARIYPLHIAVLLALTVMVGSRGLLDTNFWDVADLPRHLFLLQAWTSELTWNLPAWSISAEWAAYMAFPMVIAVVLKPPRLWLPLVMVAALLVCFQIIGISQVGIWKSWLGWPAASRIAAEFTLGIFGFRLVRTIPVSIWGDAVAVIAFVAVFLSPVAILQVVAIGVAVPAIGVGSGFVCRLLSSRVCVAGGVFSYALYLVHFPAIKIIQNINDKIGSAHLPVAANLILMALWVAALLALAAFSYGVIERPARLWLRGLEDRSNQVTTFLKSSH